MTQELYISGQLMDMDQNTDVVLDYKSNILGDISKIEGSHSYTIELPKTRQNLRVLKDPGNPARKSETVRRYLQAKYYRNGIDLFGECMAVILSVSDSSISIALTMQGLRSLAAWSEASSSIKDLYSNEAFTEWKKVSDYDTMLTLGQGIATMNAGVDMSRVTEVFFPPAISLNTLFTRIMAATGVQNYSIPASVQQDMQSLFVPFVDIKGSRYHLQNAAHTVSTGKREPARDAVHLDFKDFDVTPDPNGWNIVAEAFRVPEGSDTFIMSLYTIMPAGTFKTTGSSYLRIIGSDDNGRDTELYIQPITVNPDGSAILSYSGTRTLDVSGSIRVWIEVSNTEEGVHTSDYENSYTFRFQGQQAIKTQDLLVSRNLPDIKQLDILKFICYFYGLAIIPTGIDGLNFVPYSVLDANKAVACDWSDRLLGGSTEEQRGETGFVLSEFAQRNIFKWAEEDYLEYSPADGVLVVNDATIQDERTIATFPFSASYHANYPLFSSTLNEDGTHEVNVNGLKPRIFRLVNDNDSASLFFTSDLSLPMRIQQYYGEYQELIREPIIQKVECRLTERDLKELDFSKPVYFRQFGHYYALESVRTSSKSDVCELRIVQI